MKAPKRERIWVPGVAWVSGERELWVGTHAGFNGHGEVFSASPIGHFGSIFEWRHSAWIVERRELNRRVVHDHAIILAEELLDPDQMPNARRWLAEQPLVCVSGMKAKRLMDAGLRVYHVEHGAEADDLLVLEGAGADRPGWRLSGSVDDLLPDALKDGASLVRGRSPEHRTFADRLLDELSRGALREISVQNALSVRKLIEPGYGYRGATDGQAARIEDVERALGPLEAVFEQIYARAKTQRKAAREMERAVLRAPSGVDDIEVPVYGQAHRRRLDELILPMVGEASSRSTGPSYLAADQQRAELVLPPRSSWVVERVDLWAPELPADLALPQAPGPTKTRPWMAIVLGLVLVVIIAVGLWLRP